MMGDDPVISSATADDGDGDAYDADDDADDAR